MCLAKAGHDVLVTDISEDRVRELNAGRSPIFEPGLDELIAENRAAGRLAFDTPPAGIGDAEVIIVAVGTPPTEVGSADLSQVRAAVSLIAREATSGSVVVMKSTVPPGTGDSFRKELASRELGYASNPEFLREGTAIEDFFHTDRIVVGAAEESTFAVLRDLYRGIDAPFVECDIASAEMIKYASNAFLATKISFINEIACVCERVGADIEPVSRGIGLDRRIGAAFLSAGIGYGGSCFPKDTRALDFLAVLNDYDFRLLKSVVEVNARQRVLPVTTLARRLGGLAGKRVAVLGLTFKPNTDDTRESPALDIAEMLMAEGASVVVHDPVGKLPSGAAAEQASDAYAALEGADAAILTVEWDEYLDLDWERVASSMRGEAVIFDGRNYLPAAEVQGAGLKYVGVGRRRP